MLVIPLYVTSVLLAAIPTLVTTASDVCTDPGRSRNGVDCEFAGWCGWQNLKNDGVDWTRTRSNGIKWYAYADMALGTSAGLTSPVLCATENNLYTLEFEYFIEASGQCMLSVSLSVNGTFLVPVWNTTQTSQTEGRLWRIQNVPIASPLASFQIIFRATRLGSEPCGPQYTAVYLDSVEMTRAGFVTTTTSTTTPDSPTPDASPTTVNVSIEISTTNITKVPTELSNSEDTNPTTTAFAVAVGAGLAVAVVVAVVAVVVVIVIVLRKRSSNNIERETFSLERRRTGVSNDFYAAVSNNAALLRDNGGSRVLRGWSSPDTSNTETISDNRPESSHYYSHPDSPTFRAGVSELQKPPNNNRLPGKGREITNEGDFVTGRGDAPSFTLTSVASRVGDDRPQNNSECSRVTTHDSYNKLSFDTAKSVPVNANSSQTYDHLNEMTVTHGEEGEYSLPQDDHETSFQDETNQGLRLKSGKGKKKQQNGQLTQGSHTTKSEQQFPHNSSDKNDSGHHGFRAQEPERPEYVNMDSVGSVRNRDVLSEEYNQLDFKGQGVLTENGNRSDDRNKPDNYSHLDKFTFDGV